MWDDVEIVTLAQAKLHKRITTTAEDADLTLKLRQAHALVLDYVARPSDTDWTNEMLAWDDDSAPAAVQGAILRQFAELVQFRGDDDPTMAPKIDGNTLSPSVKQLLMHYKRPAFA